MADRGDPADGEPGVLAHVPRGRPARCARGRPARPPCPCRPGGPRGEDEQGLRSPSWRRRDEDEALAISAGETPSGLGGGLACARRWGGGARSGVDVVQRARVSMTGRTPGCARTGRAPTPGRPALGSWRQRSGRDGSTGGRVRLYRLSVVERDASNDVRLAPTVRPGILPVEAGQCSWCAGTTDPSGVRVECVLPERPTRRARPSRPRRDRAPAAFVWRGRRYTVSRCSTRGRSAAPGGATSATSPGRAGLPSPQRRVWRVEARPPPGRPGSSTSAATTTDWLLLRAHD